MYKIKAENPDRNFQLKNYSISTCDIFFLFN